MESFLVSSCLELQVGRDGCSLLIRRRRPLTQNNNKQTNKQTTRTSATNSKSNNMHNNQAGGDGELSCFLFFILQVGRNGR